MKFTFYCITCAAVDRVKVASEGVAMDVRDDGIYEFECARGHKAFYELAEERFEILFEIGVKAISDTYYREAVSSFTAALERFYEFSIKVYIAKNLKLNGKSLNYENFEAAWKQVSKQSERQYGAYIFLHYSLMGEAPPLQTNNERSFRNQVIHQGIYSTKPAAIEYGDSVLALLRSGAETLRLNFREEMNIVSLWSRMDVRKKAPKDARFGILCQPMVVDLYDAGGADIPLKTLSEILG
jgi:hypothetical protein